MKSMTQPDYQRLEHILDYCTDILETTARFDESEEIFLGDKVYQQSVAFCILQIGELANGLSEEYRRETAAAVAWRQIRGMRNIVAHNYGSVSLSVLWSTVRDDIPNLAQFCKKELGS